MTKVCDVSFVALAALSAMLGLAGNVDAEDVQPTIVTIGDSYITGYHIAATDKFPAKLQSELNAAGHQATVVDVGYKNDSRAGLIWLTTSKAGLDLQANPANHAVIVELGQNDCPIGIKLDQTRANLDQLLSIFDGKRVPVLVVGTAAYFYCGPDYAEPYSKMFSELATKHGDLLYADFKEGVTGHTELLQADNDHPNAAGDAIIVRNMLPMVEALLAQVQPR
jgi:acyl-CoA thioesterase I